MIRQKFGEPKVTFSWVIDDDIDEKSIFDEKNKEDFFNAIMLCLKQNYEIRIGSDGYCLMLEANNGQSDYCDGSYQYVDDDCEVFIGKTMPNGTYQYFLDEDEYNETLQKFLKENPYYKQNEYGIWYDEREQKTFEEIYLKNELDEVYLKKDENN